MRGFLDRIYLWSGWLAAGFVAAICALVFSQVMLNLVDRVSTLLTGEAIGLTIPSYGDFTGFFLAAASFLALAHTMREGGHIRVSLILQMLPERARRIADLWGVGLAALVSLYFSWYMADLIRESFVYNDLSPGMIATPIWIPQSALLLGLVILSISLLDDLAGLLKGGTASFTGKGESLLEDKDTLPASILDGE